MSTGWKLARLGGTVVLSAAVLCAGASAATQSHHKKKPKAPPPPLPSGPTGPVQQMPLDSIAAVPPQVTFRDNQLTIVAPNSTLADILRAVRKQTGAEIDVPSAPDRVVTNLGPGPAREVLADLLNGSRFNYVLLGSPGNEAVLTRVVLVQKQMTQQPAVAANTQEPQPGNVQQPTPEQDQSAQANDADAQDDSATDDNSAEQQAPAEAEQQPQQDQQQQNVKTPQQMLQEMQQRQLMMQQGQPNPGSGMPPHPPQQQ